MPDPTPFPTAQVHQDGCQVTTGSGCVPWLRPTPPGIGSSFLGGHNPTAVVHSQFVLTRSLIETLSIFS